MPWNILFYTLPGGKCPTIVFLDALADADRRIILDKFARIRIVGPNYNPTWVKAIGNGLYEFRFHIRDGIVRFFFFYQANQIIVLTHGFLKKTNKTPQQEIEMARSYMRAWIEEHNL